MNIVDEYSLLFEDKGCYLYAFVSGPKDSLEISKRFWEQIHSKAQESGHIVILVVEDFPNQIGTFEMHQCVEFITRTFDYRYKIAHVDKRLSDVELNSFGETVAVNRGLNAKVFNKLKDAEDWITT